MEPSPIVVDEWCIGQFQVTAEPDDMSAGLGLEGYVGDDDYMQRSRTLLVEQFRLVPPGLDVPLYGGLFAELARDIVVIHLVTMLALGAPSGIGAAGGEGQRRIASPLGNQVQVALPSHMHGVVVPNMTVQHPVCQQHIPGDPFQEGVEPGAQGP